MSTKGTTRGPKEEKRVNKTKDDTPNFQRRKKQQENQVGMKKK